MTIHLHTGKDNASLKRSENKIQSVPCRIYAERNTKVSSFCEPYVRNSSNNTLETTFRGYPLKGQCINLPANYLGIVVEKKIGRRIGKKDRKLYVTNNFKSITYWNWDKLPSKNDRIIQALDWIDITEALHSPIIEN